MDLLTRKSCLFDFSAYQKLYLATGKCEAFFFSCSFESFVQMTGCFFVHLVPQKTQTSHCGLTFFPEQLFRLQTKNPWCEITVEMPKQQWTGTNEMVSSAQPSSST